jgi:hypothetical protein
MDFLDRTLNPITIIQLAIGIFLGYYFFGQLYFQLSNRRKISSFKNSTSHSKLDNFEGEYYLKGGRSHKFCRDDPVGLICNDDFPSEWGLFTFTHHKDTQTYTIKGPRGYYCSATNFGLVCDDTNPTEHFKIMSHPDPSTNHPSVQIYAHNSLLPVADHGNGLRGDHRDEQGYDEFKLISSQYVANTLLTAKFPRNERNLPITGAQ